MRHLHRGGCRKSDSLELRIIDHRIFTLAGVVARPLCIHTATFVTAETAGRLLISAPEITMNKLAFVLSLCSCALLVRAADTPRERMTDAANVFSEIMATPDKGIPEDLLEKAHCIVIVPGLKQAAFGI